ncbi:MAG: hypothetical protein ACQETZ_09870, partial [Candidatus Fermentibacterota bacterium]
NHSDAVQKMLRHLVKRIRSDCREGVSIQLHCYPATFRRMLADNAGNIVTHAGQTVLKATGALSVSLDIHSIWDRRNSPPQLTWT